MQETVSGSGISWAICKSAPRSRQITTPAPHHSVFTGRMPFLSPNQQRQSTKGKTHTQYTYSEICVHFGIDSVEFCKNFRKKFSIIWLLIGGIALLTDNYRDAGNYLPESEIALLTDNWGQQTQLVRKLTAPCSHLACGGSAISLVLQQATLHATVSRRV